MGYHIRPCEQFTDEFRAAGAEQLEHAVDVLTARPDGLLEAVHEARKSFKKLRSLYRLAAADHPVFRRAENARIRDMARTLSASRDATALVEISRYLIEHAQSDDERVALQRVNGILSDRRDGAATGVSDIEQKIAAAIMTCGKAQESLSRMTFEKGIRRDATRLRKAWRKLLKRAHAARQACKQTTDARLFHELRKRGQDYRHYLHLLQDVWPSAMEAKRVEASEMVDLLGRHNDLALLASLVDQQPHLFGTSEDVAHLLSAVIVRQEALRLSALKLADTVFLDDPDDEARRVALLWRAAA